ncbi:MAG: hypothetical protein MK088_18605 [Alteromonas sp.]|nr:hypothetical protein [Alteromonas sp.]
MITRKEDELDLHAMEIADKLKGSDSLRLPRDSKFAMSALKAFANPKRAKCKDGAA